MSGQYVAAVFVIFLLAGFVKGVVGFGLPTVSIGLMTLVAAPVEAAALMIVPSVVTNLWQAFAGPRFTVICRRLWTLLSGICVGTWIGSGLLADSAGADRAVAALGVTLALYAALGLARVHFSVGRRAETWLSPLVGVVTGVVTGATGILVIPSAPYIQALGMDKDSTVQAFGLSFTVSTIALAVALSLRAAYPVSVAGASALAFLPAGIGMAIGQWARGRVSETAFRRCFLIGLFVLGSYLALRAVL